MIGARLWGPVLALGCIALSAGAGADEAAPADAQAVVRKQIDAFEHGDDAGAWRLAAPEIRDKFASAEEFAGMVKQRYGPVYRHRSVEIGPATQRGDEVGVVVTLVSEDNEVWSALFVVSRQGDGGWRTQSCVLAKAPQTSL